MRDIAPEVEEKCSVDYDVAQCSHPHKCVIVDRTLNRILGPNPAPCSDSGLLRENGETKLTIPRRAIEVIHAVNGDIDGYQKAESDPQAGDNDETVIQAHLGLRFLLCVGLAIDMDGLPETEYPEGM